jgi:hypothetical protein
MWVRMAAKSRWVDLTAGGSPNAVSWRHNPQWLLCVTKPTRIIVTLSVPQPTGAGPAAPPPIGLYVLRGNAAPHQRRRKLSLAEGDVVESVEPKFGRRLTKEVMLLPPAAGQPPNYVLMPYCFYPGVEMDFSLVVRPSASTPPPHRPRSSPPASQCHPSHHPLTGAR